MHISRVMVSGLPHVARQGRCHVARLRRALQVCGPAAFLGKNGRMRGMCRRRIRHGDHQDGKPKRRPLWVVAAVTIAAWRRTPALAQLSAGSIAGTLEDPLRAPLRACSTWQLRVISAWAGPATFSFRVKRRAPNGG